MILKADSCYCAHCHYIYRSILRKTRRISKVLLITFSKAYTIEIAIARNRKLRTERGEKFDQQNLKVGS